LGRWASVFFVALQAGEVVARKKINTDAIGLLVHQVIKSRLRAPGAIFVECPSHNFNRQLGARMRRQRGRVAQNPPPIFGEQQLEALAMFSNERLIRPLGGMKRLVLSSSA
jgi:hypothetical protein